MTTTIDTTEIATQFNRLDGVTKFLLFDVIHALSVGRLTGEELDAATERMIAGADKANELESLVHLANQRIYDAPLVD